MQGSIVEVLNSELDFMDTKMYMHYRLAHTCHRRTPFCFRLAMSGPHAEGTGLAEDATARADVHE